MTIPPFNKTWADDEIICHPLILALLARYLRNSTNMSEESSSGWNRGGCSTPLLPERESRKDGILWWLGAKFVPWVLQVPFVGAHYLMLGGSTSKTSKHDAKCFIESPEANCPRMLFSNFPGFFQVFLSAFFASALTLMALVWSCQSGDSCSQGCFFAVVCLWVQILFGSKKIATHP